MTKEIAKSNVERLPVGENADQIMGVIERIALSPDVPIDRLEKLLEMQERILARQERSAFNSSLTGAMTEMPTIPKRGSGHNNTRYSLLSDIVNVTRPVLARHGLTLTFGTVVNTESVVVSAELRHEFGHMTKVEIALPRDTSGSKNAVQAIGSSQTYGQRYTAQAILGLSLDDAMDDDAKGATKGTINADQFIALRDKVEAAGVDESVILTAVKAASLEQVPAKDFDGLIKKLDATIKKNKEA